MSKSFYFFARSENADTNPLDGKFVSAYPPGNEANAGEVPAALKVFSGQYWFVELPGGKHKAMSSEDIGATLLEGKTARSISGPFSTLKEAEKSLERYWEKIMGRDDE